MRKVLALLGVLALGMSAYAQTAQTPFKLKVAADKIQTGAETVRVAGSVSFRLQDGTLVTADEAVMNPTTRQVQLRGNVTLLIPPTTQMLPAGAGR